MMEEFAEINYFESLLQEANVLKKYKKNLLKQEVEDSGTDLPYYILYDILVKFPASYLYENSRLVCKLWKDIISRSDFIVENALQAKSQALIQQSSTSPKSHYFKVQLMEMDELKLDYKLHEVRVCPMGRVRSSCNGMLLLNHPKHECVLQVVNVVTRCYQTLPKCPSGCPHRECGCALTYDPFTKVYKVVHVYADLFGFEIFALGCSDNAWRRVPGPWKDPWEQPFDLEFRWSEPVLVRGRFLHWYVNSHEYIISMDVSDESFRATLFPGCDYPIKRDNYALLELGDCLSFVCHGFDGNIDVWVLEDFHRQVWFRKHSISAETISYTTNYDSLSSVKYNNAVPNLDKLIPLGSLRNGEVLAFAHKHSNAFYVYETRRREMKKLKMPMKDAKPFIPHRSTLLHWNTPNES